MGRAKAEVTLVAIGKPQQLRAVVVPAAGFTPQLGGLHGGQQDFLGAGPIHLFTHYRLNFA